MLFNLDSITVGENRQRREFNADSICDLAESIARKGLMHPPVVRVTADRILLVAGERRLRAMRDLFEFEIPFRCNDEPVPRGMVPVTLLSDLDELSLREAELEENTLRVDLTLQERATAIRDLHELRTKQKAERGITHTIAETSAEVGFTKASAVSKYCQVANNLHIPAVAEAKTLAEAHRALERQAMKSKFADAIVAGKASPHACLLGDSLELLDGMPDSFDCIVTDPPYGMAAQRMNTFGTNKHGYEDGQDYWRELMTAYAEVSFKSAKSEAHMYVFCSILYAFPLRDMLKAAGWKVWKYPMIWARGSGLIPVPDFGPMRSYDAILFANKGEKRVLSCGADVLAYPIRKETGFSAEKPVDLYCDLLSRSVGPGAQVCDPFCGSGTIFAAAHRLNLIATGIERDAETFKIALGRMNLV